MFLDRAYVYPYLESIDRAYQRYDIMATHISLIIGGMLYMYCWKAIKLDFRLWREGYALIGSLPLLEDLRS